MQSESYADGRKVVELFKLAASEKEARKQLAVMRRKALARGASQVVQKRVGRNDTCPCGSGNKFKKCCLGQEWRREVESSNKTKAEALKEAGA